MPLEKLRPSFSFDEERIKQLKQIAPEAFADNQINWEVLKEALGNYLEEDEGDVEHFGLFWPGKREARKMASIPSKGTLAPCPGEGIDEENTRNIFIEGENLEVLKILQKSYAGRIKMIYIDPPYNTGNDFVYNDDFTEPLEEYLRRTGQIDEQGKPLTTNKRSDGRFHSKWLSMIYPRLRLGRNLLSEDGIMFISIGEEEISSLKIILDEVFGEENKIAIVSRVTKLGGNAGDFFAPSLDYILIYAKGKEVAEKFREDVTPKNLERIYKERDEIGPFYWRNFYESALELERSRNARFFIETPDGKKIIPPKGKRWRRIEETFLAEKERGEILFKKDSKSPHVDENGQPAGWNIYYKLRPKPYVPNNVFVYIEDSQNALGTKALSDLDIPFEFSKPPNLISRLCRLCASTNDTEEFIVLDFFAGSASTAQAVLDLNKSSSFKLSFIMIQMAEEIENNQVRKRFKTIAALGKERIRRAIKYYKYRNFAGFKVFKLNESNYRTWENYKGDNIQKIETLFDNISSSLKWEWVEQDLLFEVILIEGFPLDSKIEEIKEYKENKLQQVTSDFCEHKLFICLDKKVQSETIKNLQIGDTDIFICLDNAITDEEKVTLSDKGLIKTI